MHRDSLEKFILENRASFDEAIPSLSVWADIDKRLNVRQHRRITLWRSLRMAAAVAALLFIGGLGGYYLSNTGEREEVATIEERSPEYAEIARYYEQQIDEGIQQLARFQQGEAVSEDFQQIDKTMEELKRELQYAPKGQEEQIIENLIQSYQTKVQILERVLDRIQTNKPQILNPEDDEISI